MGIVQAQILSEREPSRRLEPFIDRLRMMQAAAEARDERTQSHTRALTAGTALHVAEATAEEFAASPRDWATTHAPLLDAPLSPAAAETSAGAATPSVPSQAETSTA